MDPENCPFCDQDSKYTIEEKRSKGKLKITFSCVSCGNFFIETYQLVDVEKCLEKE